MSNKRDELAREYAQRADQWPHGGCPEAAFQAGYDARDAEVKKLVEALEVVIERYNECGGDARKLGVSLGIYTVCKQALADFRGGV